uniref:Uncharacterized protein n=1 Tax=Romanomermis culicivorax TaxID=13658 RepID=A0A915J2E4_ROMCU
MGNLANPESPKPNGNGSKAKKRKKLKKDNPNPHNGVGKTLTRSSRSTANNKKAEPTIAKGSVNNPLSKGSRSQTKNGGRRGNDGRQRNGRSLNRTRNGPILKKKQTGLKSPVAVDLMGSNQDGNAKSKQTQQQQKLKQHQTIGKSAQKKHQTPLQDEKMLADAPHMYRKPASPSTSPTTIAAPKALPAAANKPRYVVTKGKKGKEICVKSHNGTVVRVMKMKVCLKVLGKSAADQVTSKRNISSANDPANEPVRPPRALNERIQKDDPHAEKLTTTQGNTSTIASSTINGMTTSSPPKSTRRPRRFQLVTKNGQKICIRKRDKKEVDIKKC